MHTETDLPTSPGAPRARVYRHAPVTGATWIDAWVDGPPPTRAAAYERARQLQTVRAADRAAFIFVAVLFVGFVGFVVTL
jgi:hypothetical protein